MALIAPKQGTTTQGTNALVVQETLTRAHEEAKSLEDSADKYLGLQDVRWGVESGVSQLADIGRHVGLHARFSDLAVLAKPYGEGLGLELEAVVEAALFDGGVPVLVMPEGVPAPAHPKNRSGRWNESPRRCAQCARPCLS